MLSDFLNLNALLEWIRMFFIENPMARLFVIISLGYALGEIRWFSRFRLGVAAVLFVGLFFGMWDVRMKLPEIVASIGLVLFVYCVGLEAGPGFFQNFRSKGFRSLAGLVISLLLAGGICYLFTKLWDIDPLIWAGIFCGALTNTPALAAATDAARELGGGDRVNLLVQGYGISYPLAIVTLLIFLQIVMVWRKSKSISGRSPNFIYPAKTIQILNLPNGASEWTAELVERDFGIRVTRYEKMDGSLSLMSNAQMPLDLGSSIIVVGTPEKIVDAADALGRFAERDLSQEMTGFQVHRYHVSNPEVVEKPISSLNLEKIGALITRLRRGDIDLEVTSETCLQLGDRIRVLSLKETEAEVRKLFGNSMIMLSEAGYASFALGIVMGILIGQIPLPFFLGGQAIHLGSTGGALLMGLFLGSQGRTGNIVWLIPQSNNLALRQFGILLFLSCVGVQAGGGFLEVLRDQGFRLILPIMSITLIAHLTLCFCLRRFGFRDPEMWVGSCCGLQTQPAALAFASEKMDRAPLALAYATLFPIALLLKVIIAQILVHCAF